MADKTGEIKVQPIQDILADRFERYSKYIIQERALPDARDGLKPVQRRILYAMHEAGNVFDKPYHKSAKTVGNVIGNYHPHGDSSVYDAMVRLSQDWKMNFPLVDMQGNNGSIDDDPAAAMRYTEARLSRLSGFLLQDIDKETVAWAPNFSDEKMEPVVLPASYPNLLVHGISGIASGYATNIPPFNLTEVLDGCIALLKDSQADLASIILGPDFPTGANIMGTDGIRSMFKTGRGKIVVRGTTEIRQQKNNKQILITQIPYEVVKSSLVRRIDDLRLNHKVEGILDVRDESDRNGLRIAIDLKKEAPEKEILNYLYKNTELQVNYNANMVAIVNQRPVLLPVREALLAFLAHRREVVLARTRYDLAKARTRLHLLEGLVKAVSVLDEVIAIIRKSAGKAEAKVNLQARFGFTPEQAEAIVSMRLYRLSSTDIVELQKEYDDLQREAVRLEGILQSERKLKNLLVKELETVKKAFPSPRRTRILEEEGTVVVDETAMIPDEQVMLAVSRDGYVKRSSLRSYTASNEGISGHKEGDVILYQGQGGTRENLLLFTDRGRYAIVPVWQVPEGKWKDMGTHIGAVVRLEPNEKLAGAAVLTEFSSGVHVITLTEKGQVKRTSLDAFASPRKNRAMAAMKVGELDALCQVLFSASEEDVLLLVTENGYGLQYPVRSIPQNSVRAKGVRGIGLEPEDRIVGSGLVRAGQQLVLQADDGKRKRMKLDQVPSLKRGARGSRLFKAVKTRPVKLLWGALAPADGTLPLQNSVCSVKDVSLLGASGTFGLDVHEPDVPMTSLPVIGKGNWHKEQEAEQPSLFEEEA